MSKNLLFGDAVKFVRLAWQPKNNIVDLVSHSCKDFTSLSCIYLLIYDNRGNSNSDTDNINYYCSLSGMVS